MSNEPLPKVQVGAIFEWRGKMWRRGIASFIVLMDAVLELSMNNTSAVKNDGVGN